MEKKNYGILSLPVIVAALGYFVDIYDLLLIPRLNQRPQKILPMHTRQHHEQSQLKNLLLNKE